MVTPGQFEDRREQIWIAFAAAAIVDPRPSVESAAHRADGMLEEFAERFVKEDEPR